jgi:hypothetical protein
MNAQAWHAHRPLHRGPRPRRALNLGEVGAGGSGPLQLMAAVDLSFGRVALAASAGACVSALRIRHPPSLACWARFVASLVARPQLMAAVDLLGAC